jgi:histidinol dehydrogenase
LTLETLDLRSDAAAELPAPRRAALDPDVVERTREIVARVRAEGDTALLDLAMRFDGADLRASGLVVAPQEFEAAERSVPAQLRDAIERMVDRLRDFHARQVPPEWWDERDGVRFGEIVRPVSSAGCYVPGGRAAYPSTVCMTVVPARVAGVERVVVCTPPSPDGSVSPAVLVAARRAGADTVVKAGGAHAIAAMAYGTESVPRVDVVVGPGNVYVTAAKREVSGDVGTDSLAGPSELVIVADGGADAGVLAGDLVAQAEHDPLASTTLVTIDAGLAERVGEALDAEVARAARRDIVSSSIKLARAVVVEDLDRAAEVVDTLAPEHLLIVVAEPRSFLAGVHNAGSIFLGQWAAVAFGDYGAGSNHVLPTMGTARFSSGLRATDFLTVSSVTEMDPEAAARLAPEIATIARAEGLDAHARSVEARVPDG